MYDSITQVKGGTKNMESCMCYGGSYGSSASRSFLTREEKIEMLKEYKEDLELEVKGVSERISELESDK